MYALTDHADIIRYLIRSIGNPHATGKIDKGNLNTGLFFQLDYKFKQSLCQSRVIIIRHGIAYQKGMQAKTLCTFITQDLVSLEKLLFSHAILGIPRIIHDPIRNLIDTARIVTQTDRLRNVSDRIL